MLSTENQILYIIKKEKEGTLFFSEDFIAISNSKTVSKALERLTDKGEIRRVARGIYKKPVFSKYIGEVTAASGDAIAKAIAKRDKARIIPTGVYALNALGLSTQVQMNHVYLTDGAARRVHLEGSRWGILFKRVSPKNLATKGEISGLVIQALKAIGKNKVYDHEKKRILELLQKEDVEKLKHDITLAPEWIRKIMREAINH